MSSILDALRKLEKEKTERGEMLSTAVAGEILRVDHCRRQRRWLLPAMLLVIVLLAVVSVVLLQVPDAPLPPPDPVAESTPRVQPAEAPSVLVPAVEAAARPGDLPVLSGIVYQAQRDARIAILNDLPTMEGADIAGYRLQEILPDRVVLTQQGRKYEVPLFTGQNEP